MADAAMAKLEKPETQEPPSAEPPRQEAPQATTAEPVLPAPAMVNTELSQQELEAFRAWQRKQAEEKQEAGAPTSPPKKQRTADEEDLAEFERKLTELDINFGDLDPELQNRLRSSTSSRKDFLAIHSTDRCYNPEDGTWMPQAIAKKREFGAITGRDVPDITAEANVQAAMMKYHEKSILPSLDQLYQCCDGFYKMAQHEFALTQYSLERQAAQIQTLERARTNKTVLLMDLPPIYSKKVLDNNMQYYLQLANLSWDTVAAVHNHMVTSHTSVVRVEFITEMQAMTFRDSMRQGRRYWRTGDGNDVKLRVEADLPTDDRISMQPYYALLDILAELVAEAANEDNVSLQTWRQTLQIWTPRGEEPKVLLGQISYVLDSRFARRYSCLLLIHDRFYDQALARWHAKFSRRLRDTLYLVQALRRSTADRTTVQRASFDKAFDLTTASHPQAFPYQIMPVRISDDLAMMLESHPMLPFQGAGGMTALTAQAFLDQGYEDYGKGSPKAKGSGKGKQPQKRTDYQDSWKPRMGTSSSSYQGWSQTQGWQDNNRKGKDKGKDKGPGKGKDKGKEQPKAKGDWKDRDHDSRTNWKKDDDQDDYDSWGSGWSSGTYPRTHQTPLFGTPSGHQQQPQNKGKGRGKLQPVFICEKCSCALGYCIDCPNCKTHPVPPGFMWKDTVQWQALICPCITNSQQLCNKPLGHTQDCSFCQEHRKYWSSKQAQDSWTTLPTATKCMILQLDRILFDLDPIMQAPAVTTQFLEQMNKLFVDTGYQDYTPQQHAAYWVHSVFSADLTTLIPPPKPTRLPWSNPNWAMTEQQIVNMWGPLLDPVLQATFYTASWFAQYFKEVWARHFEELSQPYQLGEWARNVDICHSPMMPWDRLIASSLWLAYEQAKLSNKDPPDLAWTQQLLEWFLQETWSRTTTDLFQTLAEEFVWYLDNDLTLKACIQATAPFDNKGVGTSAGYGSLFFDAVFWQIAAVYGVLRDPKKSQLQAPNNELVKLLEYILPLLTFTTDEIQAVQWRSHVNKGNIMETIMLALAESGAHLLTWKTAWAMFQHQHKGTRHPWVQIVSVY